MLLFVVGIMLNYLLLNPFSFEETLSFYINGQAKTQGVKQRIFKSVKCEKVFTTSESLFTPLKVLAKRQYIYVLDASDLKIKKFSPSGKFLRAYGKGKGKGPGEFLNPTDFAIDDNFSIWVNDPYLGIVTVINDQNLIEKTFRTKNLALKIGLCKDRVILKRSIAVEYLFDIYDTDGKYLNSFGKDIFSEQSNVGFSLLVMGGDIYCNSKFVYCAFDRLNYLLSFDLVSGNVRYMVKTIDEIKVPEIKLFELKGNPVYKIDEDEEFASLSMNLVADKIFITSGKNWKKDNTTTIVDVYSADDGSYLYSFKIPEKFKYGYFDGRYYYGVRDTVVSKWEIVFR